MTFELLGWLPTCAGLFHFLQLPSMRWVKRELNWDAELQQLSPFSRALIVLFGAGIVACIAGLGLVVVVSHGRLLETQVGRALCLFLAVFWLARGVVQGALLAAVWPQQIRWLHRSLSVLYPALGVVYATAWVLATSSRP